MRGKIQAASAMRKEIFRFASIEIQKRSRNTLRIPFAVGLAVFLGFCFVSPQVFAGAPEGTGQGLRLDDARAVARRQLWQAVGSGNTSSASVAIMADGKIVYSEGFGMADREKSIPADPKTLYNIGSISKVYVAVAALLLAEEGKLSLDKPVADYIPEFKMADPRYKDITVRMLLNHTSGLPGTECVSAYGFKYNPGLKQETLATLSRAGLKHKPGAMAVYCNDGFTLAEIVVERTSGMSYRDFLKKRIFNPLGLKQTDVSVGDLKSKDGTARFYDPESGLPLSPEALSFLGAGGLSSTPEELCYFVDAVVGGKAFFPAGVVKQMKLPQPAASPLKLRNPEISFGLGWDLTGIPLYENKGIQVLGKSGGTGEYHSMVFVVPEKRVAVAVLAAGTTGKVMDIAFNILDALLFERKQEPKRLQPPEGGKIPDSEASFAGYYAAGATLLKIEFDFKSNRLTVKNCNIDGDSVKGGYSYLDDTYFNDRGERFYFKSSNGNSYIVSSNPIFGLDNVMFQKANPRKNPVRLKVNMDGRQWLWRNTSPFDSPDLAEAYLTKSFLRKDLPGYVYFLGVKRIETPEYAGMPFDAIRDQTELKLIEKNGATWVQLSDLLYSPVDAAVSLGAGEHSVTIGTDGLNQWRRAKENLEIEATMPENGRMHVFSQNQEPLYDSALAPEKRIIVPKNSMIVLSGLPGTVFKIHAVQATLLL